MKVLIIEDETPASELMMANLRKIMPHIQILDVLQEVSTAVSWFKENPAPDLAFMDIKLSDGLSLEIFDRVDVSCPVVFTTAYDQYWQEAFRLHGIDYILKPISLERLSSCMTKYGQLQSHFNTEAIGQLLQSQSSRSPYKQRFIIRKASELVVVEAKDIAYAFSKDKISFIVTTEGKKYMPQESLTELESILDPEAFFRINRHVIASRKAIKKITLLPKSKLEIELFPDLKDEVIVSSEKSAEFKTWLEF